MRSKLLPSLKKSAVLFFSHNIWLKMKFNWAEIKWRESSLTFLLHLNGFFLFSFFFLMKAKKRKSGCSMVGVHEPNPNPFRVLKSTPKSWKSADPNFTFALVRSCGHEFSPTKVAALGKRKAIFSNSSHYSSKISQKSKKIDPTKKIK